MRSQEEAERWLRANGWRAVSFGATAMWTHDYLVRDGGKQMLSFNDAVAKQEAWERGA
jgi:hypothetical protein